jgi:hypothetical protein
MILEVRSLKILWIMPGAFIILSHWMTLVITVPPERAKSVEELWIGDSINSFG